jgi:SAM-dependent methyltransferase
MLELQELRVLLSEALSRVPPGEPERWDRVATYVHERCPGSPRRAGADFESALREVARSVPGSEALPVDASRGRETWARLLYDAAQQALGSPREFLNLGYEGPLPAQTGRLDDEDREQRRSLQLYQRLIGGRQLRDRDALEVGCGWGGGCRFLARSLGSRRVVGMDLVPANVRLCRANHPGEISFLAGTADALPFGRGSFDVVLSLQSSYAYPSMAGFALEARRVLRDGGLLLLGDLRQGPHEWDLTRDQLESSGLILEDEQDISAGVIASIEAEARERDRLLREAEDGAGERRALLQELLRLAAAAAEGLLEGRARFKTLALRRQDSLT